jgi:hypothetical protein
MALGNYRDRAKAPSKLSQEPHANVAISFQSIGSRGLPVSTLIVRSMTSLGTVGGQFVDDCKRLLSPSENWAERAVRLGPLRLVHQSRSFCQAISRKANAGASDFFGAPRGIFRGWIGRSRGLCYRPHLIADRSESFPSRFWGEALRFGLQ